MAPTYPSQIAEQENQSENDEHHRPGERPLSPWHRRRNGWRNLHCASHGSPHWGAALHLKTERPALNPLAALEAQVEPAEPFVPPAEPPQLQASVPATYVPNRGRPDYR